MDSPHVQEPLVVDMMEGELAGRVGSGFDRDVSSTQQMTTVGLCAFPDSRMIAKIHQDAVIDPLWLKIPHHSSSSSTRLIEILEQTGQYQLLSGTTVKIQSKLPNPIILNRYHNLLDFLYCTGVPQTEGDPCFGIIKYVFDLFGEFDVYITCEGNARVVQGLIIILYVFADFPTL